MEGGSCCGCRGAGREAARVAPEHQQLDAGSGGADSEGDEVFPAGQVGVECERCDHGDHGQATKARAAQHDGDVHGQAAGRRRGPVSSACCQEVGSPPATPATHWSIAIPRPTSSTGWSSAPRTCTAGWAAMTSERSSTPAEHDPRRRVRRPCRRLPALRLGLGRRGVGALTLTRPR
jgi:hypothetical protein